MIAVVIPCYRVVGLVEKVLAAMPALVDRVYCVDDACPDRSGDHIEAVCRDPRVTVLRHTENQGVGGAVLTGYRRAVADGATVVVKIDGDGQMDPALVPLFVKPILSGQSDYAKGNRFFNIEDVRAMPPVRLFGNLILSFMTKFSSGYWNIFDPTNGYTAIHATIIKALPLEKLSSRYFFESDMLFRLNVMRCVVADVPIVAHYGEEESGLVISKIIKPFIIGNVRNFAKRIFYNYFIRDFSIASVEMVVGVPLFLFGFIFGIWHWVLSNVEGTVASSGTVMLSALPIIIGMQFLLSAMHYDIRNVPQRAIHPLLTSQSTDA